MSVEQNLNEFVDRLFSHVCAPGDCSCAPSAEDYEKIKVAIVKFKEATHMAFSSDLFK